MITVNKSDYDFIFDCFVYACKYLQKHPPGFFDENVSVEEIRACVGTNTYEDGWKQWARYFVDQVLKEMKEGELI